MKKILSAFLLGFALINFGGCMETPKSLEGKEGLFAVINTSKGDIVLELFYKDTPLTVTNFVGLAEGTMNATKGKKFYDGLKFHRVIAEFMIQGGDPMGTGAGGPGYKFADEWCDKYSFDSPGYLAMANAGPNTNGSQFFITHVPTGWLNGKHTIFGKVVDQASQNVVNAVAQGDKMNSVRIYRLGDEAKAFKATQKEFDELSKGIVEKAEKAKKEAFDKAIAGCEKTSDGIYYKITEKGEGTVCGKNKSVTVEYKGYLLDGTVFDGSKYFLPNQGHAALDFITASGQMIKGFDLMVQEMKYGEVRTIILPPEMHYGPRGYGPIPANSYIAFDIKLVK